MRKRMMWHEINLAMCWINWSEFKQHDCGDLDIYSSDSLFFFSRIKLSYPLIYFQINYWAIHRDSIKKLTLKVYQHQQYPYTVCIKHRTISECILLCWNSRNTTQVKPTEQNSAVTRLCIIKKSVLSSFVMNHWKSIIKHQEKLRWYIKLWSTHNEQQPLMQHKCSHQIPICWYYS